jgi:hypothetical protein
MKIPTINSNKTKITSLAAAVALLGLGAVQAQGQSVNFTFADAGPDGWANAGFGGTPAATVTNISGQNYIFLPLGGFQVGNVSSSSSTLPSFATTMAAAFLNPAGYTLSYDYNINTAAFTGATFLQVGSFINAGSGYYQQDFPSSGKEVELSGTQLASGGVFTGHVSINMSVFPTDAAAATETSFRLGFIENGNGTGTGVNFSNISIAPVPEPSTLALTGLGAVGGLLAIRRRKA